MDYIFSTLCNTRDNFSKMKRDDLVSVITEDHPVLKFGDLCCVRHVHETHIEVIRGEDERHTSIAPDLIKIISNDIST